MKRGTRARLDVTQSIGFGVGLTASLLASYAASADTRYVWQDSPNSTAPYTGWTTAAHVIQDAVDAAADGDTVLVAGGVYSTGGRAVFGTMTNRVAIDRAITVESLMGPDVTVIEGAPAPESTDGNGDGAVRCVYLGTNAVLNGFTLTNGHTRTGGYTLEEQSGGGAWCETSATLTNCILTGNSADAQGGGCYEGTLYDSVLSSNVALKVFGGGAFRSTLHHCTVARNHAGSDGGGVFEGTLYDCTLTGNSADYGGGSSRNSTLYNCMLSGNSAFKWGGGASGGTLYNCTLENNSASLGGGACFGTLHNCTLTANSAGDQGGGSYAGTLNNCVLTGNSARQGGGASGGTLYNCTLTGNLAESSGGGSSGGTHYNCIVYFNSAPEGANYADNTGVWGGIVPPVFNYCCTAPLPSDGANNIAVDPRMASLTHLSASSPCFSAGSSAYASGADIDGEPWADPPCMGADQLTLDQATGALSVAIQAAYTNASAEFAVRFIADIHGILLTSVWDFGDGMVITNQPIVSHAWNAPGTYTVHLTGYNRSFPGGVTTEVQIEVTERVFYVNQANPTPLFPYTSWAAAATNIQDAIAARNTLGRLVLVTNGVYASGTVEATGTNRIALTPILKVRSINGPEATVIRGAAGIRCAYVGMDAILSGFTLTNGTLTITNFPADGGGAWCEDSAILTNCIVAGNSALDGGGVSGGTLYNCTVVGNAAYGITLGWRYHLGGKGGGSAWGRLYNCTLTHNSAELGGGAFGGTLYNCRLTENGASVGGGGSCQGALYNCTLTGNSASYVGGGMSDGVLHNCIAYFNSAPFEPNYNSSTFRYSCTTPLPTNGVSNITNTPLFVNTNGWSDLHLRYGSPGIDAGTNLSAILTTDFDGNPRLLDGDGDGLAAFDMGAYEFDARSMIPSDWFTSHGLDPSDPQVVSGNPDGDAFTTFQEWLADTDPTNALSFFHIEDISKHSPATVSFQSSTNRTYTLWSTPQLAPADWTPVPGEHAIPGNGGTLTLSDPASSPQQFYRVQVNLP